MAKYRDPNSELAAAYRFSDPDTYGPDVPDDKILAFEKQQDPQTYQDAYQKVAVKQAIANSPTITPPPAQAPDLVDRLGNVVGRIGDAINGPIGGPVDDARDALSALAHKANDYVEKGLDEIDPNGMVKTAGLSRPIPESLAQALGAAAAYGLGHGPTAAPGEEAVHLAGEAPATKEVPAIDAKTGILAPQTVLDADAIAKQENILKPSIHNGLAQQAVRDNQNAVQLYKNSEHNTLDKLVGENSALGDVPIKPTEFNSAIKDAAMPLSQLPAKLQTGPVAKFVKAFEPPDMSDMAPKGASMVTDLERAKKESMTTSEAIEARKALNSAFTNGNNPQVDNFIMNAKSALDEDIQRDANPIVTKQHAKALAADNLYYDTFHNDTAVQKFLQTSPDLAHKVATSSLDNLNDIEAAGGETAMEHLRRSVGYGISSDIGYGNPSGNDIKAKFHDNEALSQLFDKDSQNRFADIADQNQKAKKTNKVSAKLAEDAAKAPTNPTLGQKAVQLVKDHAIGGGAAILGEHLGGPVGGMLGGSVGELIQRHLEGK